jgi:L-ascorbate metabolism protein UlaG (beta-lactamase superfamily)
MAMTTQPSKNVEAFAESIQWFGQASIKMLHSGKTIYIDPFNLKENDKADAIFITHPHFDHFSIEDIKKVVTSETVMFCPAEVKNKASELGVSTIHAVLPGFESEWKGVAIKAVPAYNVVKTDKHPKSSNWVGYVLSLGHVKVYHAGDTERIPEMKSITCDIILLPLGQTYTMNSLEEAVNAIIDTKATVAIPIHFGMYEGKAADADKLKELLEGRVEVLIPELK